MVSIANPPKTDEEYERLKADLERFWAEEEGSMSEVHKGKVYIQPQDAVPEGVEVHRGRRGGIYYESSEAGVGEEDSPHMGKRFRDPENGLMTVVDVENGTAYVTDEYDEEFELSVEELEQRIAADPGARTVGKPQQQEEVSQKITGKLKPGELITEEDIVEIEPEWIATSSQGEHNKQSSRVAYVKPGTFSSVEGLSDSRIIMKDTESWGLKAELRTKEVFDTLGWNQCPESYQTETGMAQRWVDNSGYGGQAQLGDRVKEVSPQVMESFVQYALVTAGIMGNHDGHAGNFVVDNEKQKVWAIDNEFMSSTAIDDKTWENAVAEAWWGNHSVLEQWGVKEAEELAQLPEILAMKDKAKAHINKNMDAILISFQKAGWSEENLIQMEERLFTLGDLM